MTGTVRLAVIGGGPGGYVAAIRAAQLGCDVTLIEKDKLGGTCLNVGCIPTKALLHGAELYDEALHSAEWGVSGEVKLDFSVMQSRKKRVVSRLVKGVEGLLKSNNVHVLQGTARFLKPLCLAVATPSGELQLDFDKIIIATGSVPALPPIPGADGPRCLDSTGALALEQAPASLVIIGGGVIGVEIATLYGLLGCRITMIEMMDEILPMLDGELVQLLRRELVRRGIAIHTSARVKRIENTDVGAVVHVATGGGETAFTGEKVLLCVGRRSFTDPLHLDGVGIARDQKGRITVNARMETSVPHVYAIGDCLGQIMLAHVASAQGEIAAENAAGHTATFSAATNPSCVYSCPELAGVGLTEEAAKAEKRAYRVGRFPLLANGRTLIMNGGNGMIKVIAGKPHGEILGVHIYGPRATDLIAEAGLAIGMEATLEEVLATIHGHPTLSEALREACLAVDNRAIHMPKNV